MWSEDDARLALLELLTGGRLRRRSRQGEAFDWLASLSWTRATGRRDEIALVDERRAELVALLDRVWPEWREAHVALLVAGRPPTPGGWRGLQDAHRAERVPALPSHVNRRTASALTSSGSKVGLTSSRREVLADHVVTSDGVARLRPPPGLVVRRGDQALSLDEVVGVLGEVALPDRALRDGLRIEGPVEAVLLVENLGAWRDMPRPSGWMLVHVPGWDTATSRPLLTALGDVPIVHFGDLDPNGVRIHRHLRALVPELGWFVPDFAADLLELHARPRAWPDDLDLTDAPELVRRLAEEGRWLEQEVLAVHPDLPRAMERALATCRA